MKGMKVIYKPLGEDYAYTLATFRPRETEYHNDIVDVARDQDLDVEFLVVLIESIGSEYLEKIGDDVELQLLAKEYVNEIRLELFEI